MEREHTQMLFMHLLYFGHSFHMAVNSAYASGKYNSRISSISSPPPRAHRFYHLSISFFCHYASARVTTCPTLCRTVEQFDICIASHILLSMSLIFIWANKARTIVP